jgi:hypothetical protein
MPKPAGHAMVVCGDASRDRPAELLRELGYEIDHQDDPYAAMLELCRRPLVFRAVVLSLQSLYRDELQIVSAVRRRFPHITIWLTHTDGRQAALAEGMRLGAEGLISEDGLHSFADSTTPPVTLVPHPPTTFRPAPPQKDEPVAEPVPEPDKPVISAAAARSLTPPANEPVLTAEELRALLGDDE